MYRYETHFHTTPVSRCAKAGVRESLEFYKELGYAGVFITNHFIDGNIACEADLPVCDKLDFYFADYFSAKEIGKEIGIDVFLGVELSYRGTDFLVYGLPVAWYYENTEILALKKSAELPLMREAGALVVQAHPFREAKYIDHIRLFPRCVDGVEVINACRTPLENRMAEIYAENYGLLKTAGSDNHGGAAAKKLAGMESDIRLADEADFIARVRAGRMSLFACDNPLYVPPENQQNI